MIIPSLTLPLHILGAIAAGWIVTLVLVWFLLDLRFYGKEGFDFRKCRKNNVPYFLDIDVGSGNAVGYPAETKGRKGVGRIFHKSEAGAKIDPAISMGNDEPIRLPKGLDIQIHGTLDAWPTSMKTAAGIAKIKEIRLKPAYSALSRIPDKELIEILDTPDDHLTHDLKLFIERYKIPNPDATEEQIQTINKVVDGIMKDPAHQVVNWMKRDDLIALLTADLSDVPPMLEQLILRHLGPDAEIPDAFPPAVMEDLNELRENPFLAGIVSPTISPERMLEIVNGLKAEATRAIIDPKFGAFRAALKDNPNAYKTTDVTTLENILKQMIYEDMARLLNWMQWGAIIVAILVAGGVTVAIIVSVVGK